MTVWNRRMGLLAWLGAMVSAGMAQEAPAVPLRHQVIDDTDLCLDLSVWWSRNEERFLTAGLRRQPPESARMALRIAPTLRKALDSDSPDLVGAGLLALARIGHEVPETRLAGDFARHLHHRDQEVRERAALALGVAVQKGNPDTEARTAIVRAFETAVAAPGPVRPNLLVAAGLARADAAVAELWKRSKGPSDEGCAVAYCQALQLLGHREALPALRGLFESDQRRYELRRAAARALASLGEEGLGAELIRGALASANPAIQCGNLFTAGEVAVETDVDALLQALADARRAPLSRAVAAVALGTAARRTTASWSFSLGLHTNLLAAPATLSDYRTGVLDLH